MEQFVLFVILDDLLIYLCEAVDNSHGYHLKNSYSFDYENDHYVYSGNFRVSNLFDLPGGFLMSR